CVSCRRPRVATAMDGVRPGPDRDFSSESSDVFLGALRDHPFLFGSANYSRAIEHRGLARCMGSLVPRQEAFGPVAGGDGRHIDLDRPFCAPALGAPYPEHLVPIRRRGIANPVRICCVRPGLTDALRMDDFHFVAGDLALDFVNTVADRLSHPRERLKTGTDVDRWARQAGLLGSQESLHMTPRQLGRLRAIREEVYAVVEPLAHGLMPPAPALNRLGRTRARAATTRRLVPCDDKLAWEWSDVDRLIGPV